jgi:hypothetical protein
MASVDDQFRLPYATMVASLVQEVKEDIAGLLNVSLNCHSVICVTLYNQKSLKFQREGKQFYHLRGQESKNLTDMYLLLNSGIPRQLMIPGNIFIFHRLKHLFLICYLAVITLGINSYSVADYETDLYKLLEI